MIDRTWYVDRLSRALTALHQEAATDIVLGRRIREGKVVRFEVFDRELRNEIRWVLDHEDVGDCSERLVAFLDRTLEFWEKSVDLGSP
jgi:hypothetical protein